MSRGDASWLVNSRITICLSVLVCERVTVIVSAATRPSDCAPYTIDPATDPDGATEGPTTYVFPFESDADAATAAAEPAAATNRTIMFPAVVDSPPPRV